jgi:DNA processing protein
MANDDRNFWVAWSRIPGVGGVLLRRLQKQFGTLAAAWDASPGDLAAVEGLGDRKIEAIVRGRLQLDLPQFLDLHHQQNPNFWTPADPDYPQLLLEIPSPPPVLYYRGQVKPEENQGLIPAVAIVGTRHPTDHGKKWTRQLSSTLTQHGFTIVSGMAAGIDTEAHRACLQAGGRTFAVMGTGVDIVYPPENRTLYQQIAERGLVVSEYPVGTRPDRAHFPQHNRIIAGLSRAVIVTEAPEKSGALITAYVANEFNRDVYALPGSLDNKNAIGCLGLLGKGARVILGENHLLEMLGALPSVGKLQQQTQLTLPFPPAAPEIPPLDPELDRVFQTITGESISFEAIVQNAGLDAGSVSGILIQLELLGVISQLPGMRYSRSLT